MNLKSNILEILYKPYSTNIKGYIIRITDLMYIVINSRLSKPEAAETKEELIELSESNPQYSLVLLQSNGNVYKSNNIDSLGRAC